jgi:ABC-type branched-subunit amino acid transport system ATPase component/sugar phosphate permease
MEGPLLDFAVPDDLLRAAVRSSGAAAVVADLELVPGTGQGRPPAMRPILERFGYRPVFLFTAAALITLVIDNGISVLGPDIQKSFHVSDAGLAALLLLASASQIIFGVPIALWSDRGSRTRIAAVTLLLFAVVVPLMGASRSVWLFGLLAVISAIGHGPRDTTHMSYLTDAYPTEARARIFAYHGGADPVARTLGIFVLGTIASVTGSWRWALAFAVLGVPTAIGILRTREPAKGENESSHILKVSGLDHQAQVAGPKVLIGSAVQRLLRIRSLYYQLVAVSILAAAGAGISILGNLYLKRTWHLSVGHRADVALVVGCSAFLSIPIAGFVGDHMFRKRPESLLVIGGGSLIGFGIVYVSALYMPRLWMVVAGWFLAECCLAPLATALSQTVAATAPPEMRTLAFALFGVAALVFGGFLGGIVLGAISDATSVRTALTFVAPICVVGGGLMAMGSRFVRRDITLVIEDILERYQEGERRRAGGAVPALQVRNLDFSYGSQQVLFDVSLDVAEGEITALLGTNGAGKSTLLRAVAGLEHPTRGTIRLFGANSTYLEAEQVLGFGVAMLPGGKMTFPSLTVQENLRVAAHTLRKQPQRLRAAVDEVYATFPALTTRRGQKAGTLSGGEQQMLALGRVMLTKPRLLLVDELTLGLAPKIVEELIAIVRRLNAEGTTVLLVEQSVNLALTLAGHSFFLERGEVRFDGATAELLARDDLLRPVFLAAEP